MSHTLVPPPHHQEEPPAPVHEPRPDHVAARRNTQRTLVILSVLAVVMFGFAFANVPFFVWMCRQIGVLPDELKGPETIQESPDMSRPLETYWIANPNGLPISFSVKDRIQTTAVGKRAMNEYRFVNLSERTIYFKPVHDVVPMEAGKQEIMTLEKCFCFEQQKIEPRQEYVLPVVYSFGKDLDPEVTKITMAYTLFLSTKEEYEKYNAEKATKGPAAAKAAAQAAGKDGGS